MEDYKEARIKNLVHPRGASLFVGLLILVLSGSTLWAQNIAQIKLTVQ